MKKIPYGVGRNQELDKDYYTSELEPNIEMEEKYKKDVDAYKNRKKRKPKQGMAFSGIRKAIGRNGDE